MRRALDFICMLLICSMAAYAENSASRKLVLHLGFEEEAGMVCRDSSCNTAEGFRAEIIDNGKTARTEGRNGRALAFDGVRSGAKSGAVRVQNAYDPSMNRQGFTIELWMNLAADADWERGRMFFIASASGNYGPGFIFQYNWRHIQFLSGKGDSKHFWRASAPVIDYRGRWVHVAAVCDIPAKSARIYLDGKLSAEISNVEFVPPADVNPEFSIGSGWLGRGEGFRGRLDELKIYNYPLGDFEILEHAKLDL